MGWANFIIVRLRKKYFSPDTWQAAETGLFEAEAQAQQEEARHDSKGEQLAILLKLFHLVRGLLHAINFGVNLFERIGVGSAEKPAARLSGDLPQAFLVHIDLGHHDLLAAELVLHGYRRFAL